MVYTFDLLCGYLLLVPQIAPLLLAIHKRGTRQTVGHLWVIDDLSNVGATGFYVDGWLV